MRNAPGWIAATAASALLSGCVYYGCAYCYKILSYDGPEPTRYQDPRMRPLWLPTILILQDEAQQPSIHCRMKGPSADILQVVAHVRNYGWNAGGPFWTRFTVSYRERPSGNPSTKTYYVHSDWTYAGLSSSGASPQLVNGVLASSQEADVVATFDSSPGNMARDLPAGRQNIAFTDAPFNVRVVTNSEDPTNPTATLPDIGVSDRSVTCSG
jgi:hypothetical protein